MKSDPTPYTRKLRPMGSPIKGPTGGLYAMGAAEDVIRKILPETVRPVVERARGPRDLRA